MKVILRSYLINEVPFGTRSMHISSIHHRKRHWTANCNTRWLTRCQNTESEICPFIIIKFSWNVEEINKPCEIISLLFCHNISALKWSSRVIMPRKWTVREPELIRTCRSEAIQIENSLGWLNTSIGTGWTPYPSNCFPFLHRFTSLPRIERRVHVGILGCFFLSILFVLFVGWF